MSLVLQSSQDYTPQFWSKVHLSYAITRYGVFAGIDFGSRCGMAQGTVTSSMLACQLTRLSFTHVYCKWKSVEIETSSPWPGQAVNMRECAMEGFAYKRLISSMSLSLRRIPGRCNWCSRPAFASMSNTHAKDALAGRSWGLNIEFQFQLAKCT